MLRKIFIIAGLLLAINVVTAKTGTNVAQAPTVQINGYTAWNAAFTKQQDKRNGLGGNPFIGIGAANIFFTAKGISSGGLEYKLRSAMETAPGGKDSNFFTQNYIEFADSWGVFQIGNVTGPEDTMTESALNLMGGANSIDGTFGSVTNIAEGVISGVQMYGQSGKATKVNFYTPTFQGLSLGIGFTPSTARRGLDSKDNSRSTSYLFGNDSGIYPNKAGAAYGLYNTSVGLNFKHDFKVCNIALAALYITEHSRRGGADWPNNNTYDSNLEFFRYQSVNKTQSAQFTGAFGFNQWRFAAGYINNFKSRLPKADNYRIGNAGSAWNIGGQYTVGAYQFALAYFKTSRKLPSLPANNAVTYTYGAVSGNATSDVVSATVDFNALQGLKFFAELDVFKTQTDANYARFIGNSSSYTSRSITPTTKNAGGELMFGTKVSF